MPGTLQSPGSPTSPWNTPIGLNAQYAAAGIPAPDFIEVEEDIILNRPASPLRQVWTNAVGWGAGDRCDETTYAGFDVPIPDDYVVDDPPGFLFNNSAAIVMTDGVTVKEFQPFQRCTAGGRVTYYEDAQVYQYNALTDEGFDGAHGGSGLPALFGTIRTTELLTTGSYIPHVLKCLLERAALSPENSANDANFGFRFPAGSADGGFEVNYTGTVPECRMGSLLALLPAFDVDALESEPGKILARTLKWYGMVVVDERADAGGFAIATEQGPDGNLNVLFQAQWGTYVDQPDITTTAWARDVAAIIAALYVVDNNTATNVGGGGAPLIESQAGSGLGTWTIGSLTLAYADQPDEGDVEFGLVLRTSKFNPIGYAGTIVTYLSTPGNRHRVHLRLDEDNYQALYAIAQAQGEITFMAPRPRLATGRRVAIDEFSATWNRGVPGDNTTPGYWYDIWLGMVEVDSG